MSVLEARLCVVMVSGEQVDCVAGGRLACRSQNGSTALLLACMNGHLAVARWLIEEKGVDYRAEKDNVSLRRSAPGLRDRVVFKLVAVVSQ